VSPQVPGSGATARYDGGVKVSFGCNVHITSHAVFRQANFELDENSLCEDTHSSPLLSESSASPATGGRDH